MYRNNKNETYTDVGRINGIAEATRLLSGWGLKFFDDDSDGRLDLLLANGHPDDMIESYSQRVKYKEPLLLFHNDGSKSRNVSAEAGPVFAKLFSARGLAVGDFNNDGKLDVLLANNGAPPALLKNVGGGTNHWIGLRLQGVRSNRDAIGAKIVWSIKGVRRARLKTHGGSFLSSHDPREVIGLGTAGEVDHIEIKWPAPSGLIERFTDLPIDRYSIVTEGQGRRVGG